MLPLKKKFELLSAKNFETDTGILFEIDGFKFVGCKDKKATIIFDQTDSVVGLKFRYAAELKKHYEFLKHFCKFELFPNTSSWKLLEKGLSCPFRIELDYAEKATPKVFHNPDKRDLDEFCKLLIDCFYSAIVARANSVSEDFMKKSFEDDWGKFDVDTFENEWGKLDADTLFSRLLNYQDLEI